MATSVLSATYNSPYDHTIRQGDTLPVLSCTLSDDLGNPILLTGATVAFRMRNSATKVPVALTGVCTITSATNGVVQFAFSAADTANYGLFDADFIVTGTGPSTESFPNARYLSINITKGL